MHISYLRIVPPTDRRVIALADGEVLKLEQVPARPAAITYVLVASAALWVPIILVLALLAGAFN